MQKDFCILCVATTLGAWGSAQAVPNLPLSCSGPLQPDLKCSEANYQYVPGKAGLRIATPSGVWTFWENLNDNSLVRVCPLDIPSQSGCSVSRITVPKSQAAAEPIVPSRVPLRIRWVPPDRDTNGGALPPGEIVGYTLSWRIPAQSGPWTEIKLGAVSEFLFNATKGSEICFSVKAEGKSAFSDDTNTVCVNPGVVIIKPAAPADLTVTEE